MSRSDDELLDDIAAAITSIHSHLQHGPISVESVMDAVAMRLLEIGEAVKALSAGTPTRRPNTSDWISLGYGAAHDHRDRAQSARLDAA